MKTRFNKSKTKNFNLLNKIIKISLRTILYKIHRLYLYKFHKLKSKQYSKLI